MREDMRKRPRFRAKSLGWDTRELTEGVTHADGSPMEPYGIWDTEQQCWVDKWGDPSDEYWATSREVAMMRARELREAIVVSNRTAPSLRHILG